MITLTTGNILESDAQALVNTVNAVGVMGKGIALQFKKAFPDNFRAYVEACKASQVKVGAMFITETNTLGGKRYIVNFPTKRHWKGKSEMKDIEAGLRALTREVRQRGIRSIAIPPLGCGLGGLSWPEVRERIEIAFADLPDVEVRLYAPRGAPEAATMPNRTPKPSLTPGRAAFLGVLNEYGAMLFVPAVTVIEVQKLCYFLQLAGEPLRLQFQKGHYGPYADTLRHVLTGLEGHYITGWGDAPNKPLTQISLLPETAAEVRAYLAGEKAITARCDLVAELVEGFESPYGLELLGTVHWVLANELGPEKQTPEDAQAAIRAWTIRKSRMFKPPHIEAAMDRLRVLESWPARLSNQLNAHQ